MEIPPYSKRHKTRMNRLFHELSALQYTTSVHFVEVYVNGSYEGLYNLCEQVEVGKNRVNIDEALDSTNTGYLIEMDARSSSEGEEGKDYFTSAYGQTYTIKSPDTDDEDFTAEHVKYVKNCVDEALAALDSKSYERVKALIDVDSFVDGYILDELLKPVDIGFSSFYMHKDKDGKLCRGPVWDYDLSAGNTVNEPSNNTDSLYAATANIWYSKLLTYPEFRTAVAKRLSEKRCAIEERITECFELADTADASFKRNFVRRDVLGTPVSEWMSQSLASIESHDEQIEFLKEWLDESLEFLSNYYTEIP